MTSDDQNAIPASTDNTAQPQPTLEDIISLAKRRGFAYQTSEIYGGLANSYDYGPLGTLLMQNIRNLWWREFVQKRPDVLPLQSQIFQHSQTWVASGHVDSFADPLVDDTVTHKRYRADHLIEDWLMTEQGQSFDNIIVEDMTITEMATLIKENNILSPGGNSVSEPKEFNLLFETQLGTVVGEKDTLYLRGETAQGLFTNFKNVLDSTRAQLPFGLANIGTSFRNEITTGQFVFRTFEFEQAEIEYFFDPNQNNWEELFENWKTAMWNFASQTLGVSEDNLRWRQHTDAERSFYSKETYDLDYRFPFGFKELWGIAYRTDYDLKAHMEHSGEDLRYRDPHSGELILPHVIEPAGGINRMFLMVLTDAYWRDQENERTVLRLKPALAPYTAAVFPLLKNKPELVEKARAVFTTLCSNFSVTWDERGNIGKRYLYQDEIGTPACITIDFDTLDDDSVTIRDRDTTQQVRVKIDEIESYLANLLKQ